MVRRTGKGKGEGEDGFHYGFLSVNVPVFVPLQPGLSLAADEGRGGEAPGGAGHTRHCTRRVPGVPGSAKRRVFNRGREVVLNSF